MTLDGAVLDTLIRPLSAHFDSPARSHAKLDNIEQREPSLKAIDDEILIARVSRSGVLAAKELQRRLGARKDPTKLIALARAGLEPELFAELGIGGH